MTRYPLTKRLYGEQGAGREQVMLFDVGCSMGVVDRWNTFGGSLQAIGFDPLETEIERLRGVETRPNVRYEAAFVGLSSTQAAERKRYEQQLTATERHDPALRARSSAWRAIQLRAYDHAQRVFNAGAPLRYAEKHLSIDDYAKERGITRVDIVKVDTDGADLEVLRGARHVLASGSLCVYVECMFHGSLSTYANSFANIDLYLRELGFSLYRLEPFGYSRAALPGPFYYDMFAQTENGQFLWADAAYLRDFAAPNYADLFGFQFGPEQILKLASLFEQFNLQDCAAELLLAHGETLPTPVEPLLDLLVPDYLGPGLSYREYILRFEREPEMLYASRQRRTLSGPSWVGERIASVDVRTARSAPAWGATLALNHDGELTVETAARPWAYAAVVALPRHSGAGLVALEVHVREGRVGLALMGSREDELSAEVWLDRTAGPCEVLIPVPDLSREQSILIRNGSPVGDRSVAALCLLRLLRT